MEEVLYVIFWLAVILISPILPQIIGFISYLLLKKHNDLVAHILGATIPPVAFFYLFKRLFHVDFNGAGQKVVILLLVAFIQLFFFLMIHLAIHNRHKLKEE